MASQGLRYKALSFKLYALSNNLLENCGPCLPTIASRKCEVVLDQTNTIVVFAFSDSLQNSVCRNVGNYTIDILQLSMFVVMPRALNNLFTSTRCCKNVFPLLCVSLDRTSQLIFLLTYTWGATDSYNPVKEESLCYRRSEELRRRSWTSMRSTTWRW